MVITFIKLSPVAIEALDGGFTDGAGNEHNQIRLAFLGGFLAAKLFQNAGHSLRVGIIHLAAVGLGEIFHN
ncbi:MAG: hypothetical protein PHC39_11010 [Proteiniphilum sp.]|nr:hypothetical protein [Proteiniphilum sp.]